MRLPADVVSYRRTPEFSESTIPAALRQDHRTRAGVWAVIHVVSGSLRYRVLGRELQEHILCPGRDGVVEPEVPHQVEPLGEVRFYVEFLRRE